MAMNLGKNKKLLTVLVLLVAAGVGAYFLTKDNDDTTRSIGTPASQSAGTNTSAQNTANGSVFAPLATKDTPFTATLTTTSNGKTTTATLKSDGKGNSSYSSKQGSNEVKLIYTSDAYYLCSGSTQCIKYPIAQSSSSGFDPSSYQYDASAISTLKSSAAYQGRKSCPAGTCDVWATSRAGIASTIFIDSATKRISQVEGSVGGQSTKIVYDYKSSVTITPPANAQSLPSDY